MFRKKARQKTSTLIVSGIEVEITQKAIKNLYLRVSPSTGKVKVSAPLHARRNSLEQFIFSRANWIQKQLDKKYTHQPIPELEYVSGETHYVDGKPHLLKVIERKGFPDVRLIENGMLALHVRPGSDRKKKQKFLNEWHRGRLKKEIPKLIEKWEPIMGVRVKEFGVKQMKTRWGTCNIRDQRIWLSLELAKKSPNCLEYVVVHEMVHLLERLHNARFHAFMTHFLPDWRERKKELNGRVC